jgi:hypothetical protein
MTQANEPTTGSELPDDGTGRVRAGTLCHRLGDTPRVEAPHSLRQRPGNRPARVGSAAVVALIAGGMLYATVATAATPKSNGAATLADPVGDVRAADLDLTSVSLSKRDGNLVVRFTLRGKIADNVRYTADVALNIASARVVAKRVAGRDSFYVDGDGGRAPASGRIQGRTVMVIAPMSSYMRSARLLAETLVRVRAYFWSQPAGQRSDGKKVDYWSQPTGGRKNGEIVDWAPQVGAPIPVWFCLSDLRPRPRFGPCLWPGPA